MTTTLRQICRALGIPEATPAGKIPGVAHEAVLRMEAAEKDRDEALETARLQADYLDTLRRDLDWEQQVVIPDLEQSRDAALARVAELEAQAEAMATYLEQLRPELQGPAVAYRKSQEGE